MADVAAKTSATNKERSRLVRCSGEGLQFLYVDVPSDVLVDTTQAGQGELEIVQR